MGLLLLLFLGILWLQPARAAASEGRHYYIPTVPSDVGAVDFYLLTVGMGDGAADRFGHTGIRVVDPYAGTDAVFGWGGYSFERPGFLWNFYRGSLIYTLTVRTFDDFVSLYDQAGRRLVMDKLNLTVQQKRRLYDKIAWNAVPVNREFPYQYWRRNCATIPRDYLDQALDGQLRARYAAAPTGRVFRDYVRRNLAAVPFIVPALDIMMNSNIDHPITVWADMFLPANLRRYLLKAEAVNDAGQVVPGTHLLTDEQVLVDRPDTYPVALNDYFVLVAPAAVSLLGALLLLLLARFGRPQFAGAARRCVGFGTLYWGLYSGLLGTVLLLNWAFSGHPDGWHNANILLFWPVDWLLVPLGWKLLRTGTRIKDRWPFLHAGKQLAIAHGIATALLVAFALDGVVTQDIWRVVTWFGLTGVAVCCLLATTGLLWRVARVAETTARGAGASEAAVPLPTRQ